ncbi:MAG: histidinol-phosphate transaminase [Chloroflexota bacterium]
MIHPRPHFLDFAPYTLPDTSVPAGMRQLQLAQNESAFGPSPNVHAAIQEAVMQQGADSARLYPDSSSTQLRTAIAETHKLNVDQIICGNGSMELISVLTLAYLRAGDTAVTSEYSYKFFRVASKATEARVITTPEPGFRVDVDVLLDAVQPDTRMVFVANPGNPTGSFLNRDEIVKLRTELRDDILLVVDEAYAEYVDRASYEPLFDLVELDNTVILRTFSKVYGLAGFRIGWGYCPPLIWDILHRVKLPDGTSNITQIAATAAMRDQAFAAEVREETARIRSWFFSALKGLGLNPQPSTCNFILCQLPSTSLAQELSEFLRSQGIVVRVMRGYDLADCVRITLGTMAEMEEVLEVLETYEGIAG